MSPTRSFRLSSTMISLIVAIVLASALPAAAATVTWTGGGTTNNWSDSLNWTGGSPQTGDSLVFPATALQKTNVNDLSGLNLNAITFNGGGYSITGNAIALTAGITDNAPCCSAANLFGLSTQLFANQTFTFGSSQFVFNGSIALQSFTLDIRTAFTNPPHMLVGVISGTGSVTIAGGGGTASVALTANNTYTGMTSVFGSVFAAINGAQPSSSVALSSGTLTGVGTIGPLVGTGGTVTPGSAINDLTATGVLSTANVSLNSPTTTYYVRLNGGTAGTGYDQLNVTGTVTLGTPTLALDFGPAFQASTGQVIIIINNDGTDPVTGGFNGRPDGSLLVANGSEFQINYDGGSGNDVTLTCTRAAKTWTGAVDNLWTTAGNWIGNVAPVAQDSLIFPPGAANLSNTNNFVAGTIFTQILITGNGYTLNGNEIVVSFGSINDSSACCGVPTTLNLPIRLGSGTGMNFGSNRVVVNSNINTGSNTLGIRTAFTNPPHVFTGVISGTGGVSISGNGGTAAVEFTGNNTYTGDFVSFATNVFGSAFFAVNGSQTSGTMMFNANILSGVGSVGPLSVTAGTITPGSTINDLIATGVLTTGDLSMSAGATYHVRINGSTPGTGHDQLMVNGTVDLGGANLALVPGPSFAPSTGQILTIINNDGTTDAVIGTFSNLPQNALLTLNGSQFQISYSGGDGNNVILTCTLASKTWSGAGVTALWTEANNWVGGVAPATGDPLVFPVGASRLTNTNDFPADTLFHSITLAGSGYDLSGNPILLSSAGITDNAACCAQNNTLNLPIRLTANTTFTFGSNRVVSSGSIDLQTFELAIRTAFTAPPHTFAGPISGTGSVTVSGAAGTASVAFTGNNSFTGASSAFGSAFLAVNGSQPGSPLTFSANILTGVGNVGALSVSSGTVTGGSTVNDLGNTGVLTTGNLTLASSSTYNVRINGSTPGVGYDQLSVLGTVDLGNAAFQVALPTFVPTIGQMYAVVMNDGVDSVTGTFAGLSEASSVSANGYTFTVSYVGGDGNDVTLTSLTGVQPTTTTLTSDVNPSISGQTVTFTATINESDPATPTGTVTFKDGATTLGTGNVGPGATATFSTSTLSLGNHNITAVYSGDTNFGSSTSAALVQYIQGPPTISGFTPANGVAGTVVTINGNDFSGATSVAFNGVAASSFSALSNTQISATVPSGTSTGKISVTTAAGTGMSAANFGIRPTITSFSPTSGAQGSSVNIVGTNFTAATSVRFSGSSATFNVLTDTSIDAVVPLFAYPGPIQVTTPGGTGTSSTNFIVNAGTRTVTNLNDSGPGSLRDALTSAGSFVCPSPCTVSFTVAGTINLLSPLTVSGTGVIINGFSAPGALPNTSPLYSPNNAQLTVVLDGSSGTANGLALGGSSNTARGLVFQNFVGRAVTVIGTNNKLTGSYVGTTPAGNAVSSGSNSIAVIGGSSHIIGGTLPAEFNVINSATFTERISIANNASLVGVVGNYIGVAADAATPLSPSGSGIVVASNAGGSNQIGISTLGNLISGNGAAGIHLAGNSSFVSNNRIGTNGSGTVAAPNNTGILITGGNNTVGRNVVAANVVGITLDQPTAVNNRLFGNFVGTDVSGDIALGNAFYGVLILNGASGNFVGGTAAGQPNVISGNTQSGVFIDNSGSGNRVLANRIGVGSSGGALGNGEHGILMQGNASGNFIGGTAPAEGNTIANNVLSGIRVSAAATQNAVLNNSVFANGQDGIDLDGATGFTNDLGDADTGPNNLQNRPVLHTGTTSPSARVTFSVDSSSVPNTGSLRVEFFKADASANAQGQQPVVGLCYAGRNLINQMVVFPAAALVMPGDRIVATATSYIDSSCSAVNDGTSEFSAPVIMCGPPPVITASGPTTFCEGGNVTLTASAGSSYLWSSGETTQSIVVSTTGSHSVTVSGGGCSATSAPTSVTVTTEPTPTITASGPTTFCEGGSVTLSASGTGPFIWSTGETTVAITVNTSGSYTVTTSISGCSATSAPTVVTVNPIPVVAISGPTSTCPGSSGTLDAGSGFAGYLWSTGETTQTITVTPAGANNNYTVTATDASGCTVSDSHVIIVGTTSTATITAPSSVSANSTGNIASVAGAQAGDTSTWTVAGGTLTSGQGTSAITFAAGSGTAVTLDVVVMTASGCTSSGSTSVAIGLDVDLAVSLTATPASVRAGDSVTYTITGRNNGPNFGSNITITQSLPNGMTLLSANGAGWVCSTAAQTLTCTTGSAAIGDMNPITVTATAPSTDGAMVSSATISSSSNDPNGSNNTATVQTLVEPQAATCTDLPPVLVAPTEAAADLEPNVVFSWMGVPGATQYNLFITSADGATFDEGPLSGTSATVSLPSGDFTWYVTASFPGDCQSTIAARRTFSVKANVDCTGNGKPTLISPDANTTAESPVTFNWTSVPNAIGYLLWTMVGSGAPESTATQATTATIPVSPGKVTWFVEAIFPGCPAIPSDGQTFNVPRDCSKSTATTLVSPIGRTTLGSSDVRFQWTKVDAADGYRVWTKVDGAATFSAVGETGANETTFDSYISLGTVEWFVETLYDGCASLEAAHDFFIVPQAQNCTSERPVPISPANGSTTSSGTVTFMWTGVAEALSYQVWLSVDNGTDTLLADAVQGTTVTVEVSRGELEWFVRASINGCPFRDSDRSRFTYQPPANCPDARPILISPPDAALTVTSPVTLDWSDVPSATGYNVYVMNGEIPQRLNTAPITDSQLRVELAPGNVVWYVEALFGSGCAALQSTMNTFTVIARSTICLTPSTPVILAPSQVSSGIEYTVRWEQALGADGYQLQEATRADFRDAVNIPLTGQAASFQHTNSTRDPQAYLYRVRSTAKCTEQPSPYSDVVTVVVLPVVTNEGSLPAENTQSITYTLTIDAAFGGQSFTATPNQSFLTVTPSSGVVGAGGTILTVIADTSDLPVGTSIGGVIITTSGTSNARSGGQALSPVPNANGSTSTSTLTVSLVNPVSPTPKNTPPPDALIIPAVAHADGINSRFQSDVRVTNTSPQVLKYQLNFTPTGEDGIASGKQTTVSIEPGQTVALDDVLRTFFSTGSTSTMGMLEIRPLTQTSSATSSAASAGLSNRLTFASSRTYNVTGNGTFGQAIAAVPFANFIGQKSGALSLQQIAQSPAYRTNLGLVEGSGQPASLLISIFGDSGQKLKDVPVQLNGGQQLQLNSFLSSQGLQVNDGRVEVRVTSPGGRVTAYASVLDNNTNDPLLVTPVNLSQTGGSKYIVPGVADLTSGPAAWRTDLRVLNAGSTPTEATLNYYSQLGGAPKTTTLTIGANQVAQFNGLLESTFGVKNDGGALQITTAQPSNLIATARTYNQTGNGTFGQFISAVTPNEAIGQGARPLQLLQIEDSDRYRSNIGIVEVTGQPAVVQITVYPPDSKTFVRTEIPMKANEFRQMRLLPQLGLNDTYNARVTIKVMSGQGKVTAYSSVIDMQTQDPTYNQAQ